MDNQTHDRVVVITGASTGIGAALAQTLGKAGARLVLAARRERELCAVAAQTGGMAVVTDVTRRAEVERLRDQALRQYGRIDVWVNNAGRGISRPVAELTDDDVDEMILINVKSALYGMQAVLPHFQSRGQGHIINVSSMLGRIPYIAARSAYSAAKHALNALSANLRMDLRVEFPDIHVSTVLPGVVATDFGLNARGGGVDSRALPFAQPASEVADLIAELIENPRTELYTRAMYKDQVVRYYQADDLADIESQPPFIASRPSRS